MWSLLENIHGYLRIHWIRDQWDIPVPIRNLCFRQSWSDRVLGLPTWYSTSYRHETRRRQICWLCRSVALVLLGRVLLSPLCAPQRNLCDDRRLLQVCKDDWLQQHVLDLWLPLLRLSHHRCQPGLGSIGISRNWSSSPWRARRFHLHGRIRWIHQDLHHLQHHLHGRSLRADVLRLLCRLHWLVNDVWRDHVKWVTKI